MAVEKGYLTLALYTRTIVVSFASSAETPGEPCVWSHSGSLHLPAGNRPLENKGPNNIDHIYAWHSD